MEGAEIMNVNIEYINSLARHIYEQLTYVDGITEDDDAIISYVLRDVMRIYTETATRN